MAELPRKEPLPMGIVNKRIALARSALNAAACIAALCATVARANANAPSPSDTYVLLSSSLPTYVSSSDVRLQFAANNRGTADVEWFLCAPQFTFDVAVTNQAGALVPPTASRERWPFRAAPAPGTIRAGTWFTFLSLDLRRSLFSLAAWGYTLPAPGTYYVQAALHGTGIVSNKIEIVLTGNQARAPEPSERRSYGRSPSTAIPAAGSTFGSVAPKTMDIGRAR
jgi:hypothetical protein